MAFFLRLLGTLLLAVATVFAVADLAQYVADDVVTMATIASVAETTGIGADLFGPEASATARVIGSWPFAISFAVLGAILVLLGRRRRSIGRS